MKDKSNVQNESTDEVRIKVNLHNPTELKNATEDRIKEYFVQAHGFKADHTATDFKLLLGIGSCLFAFYASWEGYRTSFEETKFIGLVAVVIYSIYSTLIMAYSFFIEKNSIWIGVRDAPANKEFIERLDIGTTTKKHSFEMKITISFSKQPKNGGTGEKKSETISKTYESWFDEEGYLVTNALDAVLNEGFQTATKHLKKA